MYHTYNNTPYMQVWSIAAHICFERFLILLHDFMHESKKQHYGTFYLMIAHFEGAQKCSTRHQLGEVGSDRLDQFHHVHFPPHPGYFLKGKNTRGINRTALLSLTDCHSHLLQDPHIVNNPPDFETQFQHFLMALISLISCSPVDGSVSFCSSMPRLIPKFSGWIFSGNSGFRVAASTSFKFRHVSASDALPETEIVLKFGVS